MKRLLIALTFLFSTGEAANSAEWYVTKDNWAQDTTGYGWGTSPDYPFLTIQYAINQASTNDTIYVKTGVYDEQIVINKEGLSVIGYNSSVTNAISDLDAGGGIPPRVGTNGPGNQAVLDLMSDINNVDGTNPPASLTPMPTVGTSSVTGDVVKITADFVEFPKLLGRP